jgi:hypothetical protein
MTLQPDFVQPPRLAVWLVNLFVLADQAESIHGDLLEEFSHLVSTSGAPFARSWFWRQTLKTCLQLAGVGFRTAPWLTTASIVGGFLLRKLLGPLLQPAIFGVLDRYQVYENHAGIYMFFASTGMDITHILILLLVGWAVAFAAKGREMVATTILALIYGAMAVVGSLVVVARTGDSSLMWRLTWYFADSLAIVIAGVIVRTHRLAAATRPSKT